MAFSKPLKAYVVDFHVMVCDPGEGSEILMTPEAVLESLEPLLEAARQAIEAREADERAAA